MENKPADCRQISEKKEKHEIVINDFIITNCHLHHISEILANSANLVSYLLASDLIGGGGGGGGGGEKEMKSIELESDFQSKIYKTLEYWVDTQGQNARFLTLLTIIEKHSMDAKDQLLERFKYGRQLSFVDFGSGSKVQKKIGDVPKFWNVRPRNNNFTGREKIFQNFENLINSTLFETTRLEISLYGFGGVGKSSIIREFLYRNRSKFSYIFWLNFELQFGFLNQLKLLEKLFGIFENNLENNFQELKNWFENPVNCPWILVFDSPAAASWEGHKIFEFIPKFGGIIFSTCRKSRVESPSSSFDFKISKFDQNECFLLIEKILKFRDEKQFEILAQHLEYWPLATSIICHEIKVRNMSIHDYINYSKKNEIELLQICPNFEEKSIWDSVKISLSEIKKCSPDSFRFIEFLSFFKTKQNIPAQIFLEEFLNVIKINYSSSIKEEIESSAEIYADDLILNFEIINGEKFYKFHRLSQNVIKLGAENEFEILKICFEIIISSWDKYSNLNNNNNNNYIIDHTNEILLNILGFGCRTRDLTIEICKEINKMIKCLLVKSIRFYGLQEIEELDKIFNQYFKKIKKILKSNSDLMKDLNDISYLITKTKNESKNEPSSDLPF